MVSKSRVLNSVKQIDNIEKANTVASEAKDIAESTSNTQLMALASIQVSTMDLSVLNATEAVSIRDFWSPWEPGIKDVKQNDCFTYGQKHWRASQAIPETQSIYPPGTSESLYYEVQLAEDGIIIYRTCHGDYDAVDKGELRHYPDAYGPVYESLVENNAYNPDTVPDNWKLREDIAFG